MKAEPKKIIYLIRHARSVYNQKQHEIEQLYKEQGIKIQGTPQYLNMKWNSELLDCGILEPVGAEQCIKCRQKITDIDVDLIIVSPLRRALTTCALVFKDHKSKAPIIVDPLFRQIFQSICDIGSGLRKSMKDYPEFDYSLIDNVDYWYIDNVKNQQAKAKMLDKIKSCPPQQLNQNASEMMLQYIQQLWERRKLDDPQHKPEALSPVDIQKQKLKILLQRYNSIAIVTHSENIKAYTGIKPPNCSIMKYLPEYFHLPVNEVPHQFV